jgi:hypothetical protein
MSVTYEQLLHARVGDRATISTGQVFTATEAPSHGRVVYPRIVLSDGEIYYGGVSELDETIEQLIPDRTPNVPHPD